MKYMYQKLIEKCKPWLDEVFGGEVTIDPEPMFMNGDMAFIVELPEGSDTPSNLVQINEEYGILVEKGEGRYFAYLR